MTGATSFLEVLTPRERGKLKLYIGSFAGVGKTYRMLTEAHELRRRGSTSSSGSWSHTAGLTPRPSSGTSR